MSDKKRCAKWCGLGCTQKEYDKAVRGADRLVKLLGEGWTPRVHENLGWHFNAYSKCGRFYVSRSLQKYSCLLGEPFSNAGHMGWSGQGDTPKAAVADSIRKARADMAPYMDILVDCLHCNADACIDHDHVRL